MRVNTVRRFPRLYAKIAYVRFDSTRSSDALALTDVLRDLFADKTQAAIAAELTDFGLKADQTKVSAWVRGRQPSLDQIALIEQWAGKPRGWVLARAGYVDLPDVEPLDRASVVVVPDLAARVDDLSVRLERVERRLEIG
jgi:hypothetical protein